MPVPEQLKHLYDEQFSHELPAFDLSGVVRRAKARRRRRRIGSAVGAAVASVAIVAATAGVLESRSATAVPAVVASAASSSSLTYRQNGDEVTVERGGKVIGRITVVTAGFDLRALDGLKYMTLRAKLKLMDIDPVNGDATPTHLKLLVLKVEATEKFSISTADFVGENQSSRGSTEEMTTGRRTFQIEPGSGDDRDYYWGYQPLPSNKLYWVPDAKTGIAGAWTIDDTTMTLVPGRGLPLPADAVTTLRKDGEVLKFRGSKPSGS